MSFPGDSTRAIVKVYCRFLFKGLWVENDLSTPSLPGDNYESGHPQEGLTSGAVREQVPALPPVRAWELTDLNSGDLSL